VYEYLFEVDHFINVKNEESAVIYKETGTETYMYTDRLADRRTEIERHTDIYTVRQTETEKEIHQGTLTEGEGSVLLASCLRKPVL